jgi:hypothetical protein
MENNYRHNRKIIESVEECFYETTDNDYDVSFSLGSIIDKTCFSHNTFNAIVNQDLRVKVDMPRISGEKIEDEKYLEDVMSSVCKTFRFLKSELETEYEVSINMKIDFKQKILR